MEKKSVLRNALQESVSTRQPSLQWTRFQILRHRLIIYSRTRLFRTRLIRSPRYFEGRSNSLGFTLMFSVIYYQLFRTRLFRIPRYFELIVLSLHLKSTPLFRTCQKQSMYIRAQLVLFNYKTKRTVKWTVLPRFFPLKYSCMNSAVSILIIRHCKVMFWIFFGDYKRPLRCAWWFISKHFAFFYKYIYPTYNYCIFI